MRFILGLSLIVLLQSCITINTAPQQERITKEEYQQLKPGMSVNDIRGILGVEGVYTQDWDEFYNATVKFEDTFGNSVIVYFQDAKAHTIYPLSSR